MKRILGTLGACLCLWGAHAQDVAPLHPAVQQLYTLSDSLDVQMRQAYKPLIGITAGNRKGRTDVSQEYIDAVMQTGGTPVVILTTLIRFGMASSRWLRSIRLMPYGIPTN